jgi:hypothetical protein
MSTKENLSKFIIKSALKDLQDKKKFKNLEELREELEKELVEEGYELNDDDRKKIKLIVEEDGYTGSFRIDDVLFKRLKNKKYWPVASIIIAALIFIISNIIGALIEYCVQKPLNANEPVPATVIAAFFQLPSKVHGSKLDFKVTLQNQLKNQTLKDLVLFASAEDNVTKINIDKLDPNAAPKPINGNIDIASVSKKDFMFSAYIIGANVSFQSEPIKIERDINVPGAVVAREIDSSGKGTPSVQGSTMIAYNENIDSKDEKTVKYDKKQSAEIEENSLSLKFSEVNSDKLADELINKIKDLPKDNPQYKNNVQILKALSLSGSLKAKDFIDKNK